MYNKMIDFINDLLQDKRFSDEYWLDSHDKEELKKILEKENVD